MEKITGFKKKGNQAEGNLKRAYELNNLLIDLQLGSQTSAFNTIQPILLKEKLLKMQEDSWITDYLADGPLRAAWI